MVQSRQEQLHLVIVVGLLVGLTLVSQPVMAKENPQKVDARGVVRIHDRVTVSKAFVDAVKKNNALMFSQIAVRGRAGKDGRLETWELVEVDGKSPVAKMGFRRGDRIASVNGIPARELEGRRTELETLSQWDLLIHRRGKLRRMRIEMKD